MKLQPWICVNILQIVKSRVEPEEYGSVSMIGIYVFNSDLMIRYNWVQGGFVLTVSGIFLTFDHIIYRKLVKSSFIVRF